MTRPRAASSVAISWVPADAETWAEETAGSAALGAGKPPARAAVVREMNPAIAGPLLRKPVIFDTPSFLDRPCPDTRTMTAASKRQTCLIRTYSVTIRLVGPTEGNSGGTAAVRGQCALRHQLLRRRGWSWGRSMTGIARGVNNSRVVCASRAAPKLPAPGATRTEGQRVVIRASDCVYAGPLHRASAVHRRPVSSSAGPQHRRAAPPGGSVPFRFVHASAWAGRTEAYTIPPRDRTLFANRCRSQ